jgi:hypothetical protein
VHAFEGAGPSLRTTLAPDSAMLPDAVWNGRGPMMTCRGKFYEIYEAILQHRTNPANRTALL